MPTSPFEPMPYYITCECGKEIVRKNYNKHINTKKHICEMQRRILCNW